MNTGVHKTLGVLLAAGAGNRFHGATHKLLAPLRGMPVIAHAIAALKQSGLPEQVIISGATDLSEVSGGLLCIPNPQWASGQHSSVCTAIRYARDAGYEAIVVGLGDQPFITPDAWAAIAHSDSPIAVATYDGIRGNPVKLDSSVWDLFESLKTEPDAGARTLMHLHPELVREVACKGNSADIDTTEDLSQWT